MRRNKGFYDFPAARIEFGEFAQPAADRQTLQIHELTVTLNAEGELTLRTRDGHDLALYLTLADHQYYAPFALFTPPWLGQINISLGAHTPRVLIDGVVVQRERWRLPSAEVMTADVNDDLLGFAALNRWRVVRGLPRQVYVKGSDRKPVFIDFVIPYCRKLITTLAEKAEHLVIEEMYPAADGLWLNTARGGFTSELRMSVFRTPVGGAGPQALRSVADMHRREVEPIGAAR
jgi:Lantibiotic dehydratase, N terminus